MRPARSLAFWVACVAGSTAVAQVSAPVKSARVTLLREPTSDVVLSVTNLRDVPLEYFAVELPGEGWIYWTASEVPNSVSPPGAPGATQKQVLADHPRYDPIRPPIVGMVEYSDGYYEGSDDALRKFFAERAAAAQDLNYWLDELRRMPEGLSNADAAGYVRRADEIQRERRPASPSETVNRFSGLGAVPRPTGWISQVLKAEIPRLEADLRRATRHLERAATAGVGATPVRPTSVRVEAEVVSGIRLLPVVENLRNVPLEAWSILEMVSTSPHAGVSNDTCSAHPAPPGHGAIEPGEQRRLTPLGSYSRDKTELVAISLGFVYFRDGYMEGDRAELRGVLDRRKARGVECAR